MGSPLRSPAELDRRTVLSGIQLALRSGIAAGVALAIAQASSLDFPIYAAVAALIVTDLTPSHSSLGLHRTIATILGGRLRRRAERDPSVVAWAVSYIPKLIRLPELESPRL